MTSLIGVATGLGVVKVGSTEISPLGSGVSLMTGLAEGSTEGSAATTLVAAPSAMRSAIAVDVMTDRFTVSPNVLTMYAFVAALTGLP